MLSWFLNPWMLLGGLAIASPILIHLLNKRRFKIVEWAAMDFLFQADKKNRRRVELENFILLALRCLAMLLLAFMLARPFLPSSIISLVQQAQKYERVIMIDDSLSLRVLNQNAPAIETIKSSVNELLGKLSNEKTENWLTVILTSRPDQPLLANEPLTQNTLPTLTQTINSIDTADKVADYSLALSELNRLVLGKQENMGRVVYLYSDMRERDWLENKEDVESAPNGLMNKIADETLGCFLIDVGNPEDQNLAVVSVRPDGLLLTNKSIRFNVAVSNFGSQAAQDVKVLFQIDDGQPRYETLEAIAPGQTQEVTFLHQFKSEQNDPNGEFDDESKSDDSLTRFHKVRAEIDRQSLGEAGLILDQLQEDSSSLFSAMVSDGISVLLVDGDPSAASERSETHYLKSLQVPGTGLKMTAVTVSEFETIPLGAFQVIFLCNVDEASADRVEALRQWVSDGGGLVFMPGNRVRAANFNSSFYADGSPLSPFSLNSISGSPTMNQWVNFDVSPQTHPSLQVVIDSDASSLSNVDIFSWWSVGIAADEIGKTISVPLRLTDENNSPAMAERTVGDGKVVAFAIPGDGDWSMWPSSPTYVPIVIDLIDYLVGSEISGSNLTIGGAIRLPVDLAMFQNRVSLRDPKNEKIEAIARPIKGAWNRRGKAKQKPEPENNPDSNAADSPGFGNWSRDLLRFLEEAETRKSTGTSDSESTPDGTSESGSQGVEFNDVQRRGFYSVERRRHNGSVDSSLFAVNFDARESKLTRLSASTLDSNFFSDKVTRLNPNQLADKTVSGGNSEVWPQILMLLFGILLTEQFLAWWWGRKR